jgi:hypothetical protein
MVWDTIWWVALISAVGFWLPQNVIHEGAHAVAARHWGAKIISFWPFPSKKLGYFTFAHVRWQWGERHVDETADGVIAIAPQALNTLLLMVILIFAPRIENQVAFSILFGLAVTNFVDGAYNLSTLYRKRPEKARTDGWRWAVAWYVGDKQGRALVALWQLGFALMLFAPV